MKKKSLATMAIALGLTAVIGIGATLAYMTDATKELTNTFTVGHVDIELDEPNYPGNDTNGAIKGVYPGQEIPKDPTVTVKKDSEKAYIYMKVVGIDEMQKKGYMVCSSASDKESASDVTPIDEALWKKIQTAAGGQYDGIYRYVGEGAGIKADPSDIDTTYYNKNDITICKSTTADGVDAYQLPPLFNKVIYRSSQEGGTEDSGVIIVKAAAIQADGLHAEKTVNVKDCADDLAIAKLQ